MSKVYIVGAGCGSSDHLTLKAYNLITNWAEVIFYDRLIWDEVLALIPASVEKYFVGKEADNHSKTQDEINELMVKHALDGQRVVRLKGGDPFIFGRGGEEAEYLKKHGLTFEIVPGISAAVGAAAKLNIPLTYRGVATSFRVITGHKYQDEEFDLNWQSLADDKTTLAIYMGLKNLQTITQKLIHAGLSEDTCAVAVQEATTSNEKVVWSNLKDLAKDVNDAKLKAPVLVFIGEVVAVAKKLNDI
jgi:uroporphyrin-III C-methyltransferase